MRHFILFLLVLLAYLAPAPASALPKNFRNVDTFFAGAMPSPDDLDEFYALGIRTIISLHQLPLAVHRKATRLGFDLYSFPIRTRLIRIDEIMDVLRTAPPRSVYLHCLHGADRTGAVTAYWLLSERNVEPFEALLSVISPRPEHIQGLKLLAREYGVCIAPLAPRDVGTYSGAHNGGKEGLKIYGGTWYTRLARNFLSLAIGKPTMKKNKKDERFWKLSDEKIKQKNKNTIGSIHEARGMRHE